MAIQIDYYLTPISPWSYLGSARFRALVEKHQAKVDVMVVDYGTIFPQTGGLPLPKRAPARLAYRMQELKRWRDHLGLPLTEEPAHFPSTTKLTAHCVTAAAADGDGLTASEAVLAGLWASNLNMDDPAAVTGVLDAAGLDGAKLVARAEAEADALNAMIADATEKALAANVFGAPSYVINGEVFWGQDRLDLLAWRLDQLR